MCSLKLKNPNQNYHNPVIRKSNYTTHTSTPTAHRAAHIKKVLATTWMLSNEFKDSVLLNHFLLYWDKKYFQSQVIDGTIYKDGRLFKVIYHNCTPESCTNMFPASTVSTVSTVSTQLALSFRVPRHIYEGAYPVVLVSSSHRNTNHNHNHNHNHSHHIKR